MATQQDYARIVGFVDGMQTVQLESLSIKTDSGQQPIVLLTEGLAGFTPGGGMCTISGTMYVPIGGFETDIQKFCVEGSYHTFQIGVGPKAYVGNGKFIDCEISQSTNQAMQLQFTWTGEKASFS